jgi:hypothetical protein
MWDIDLGIMGAGEFLPMILTNINKGTPSPTISLE